MSRMKQERMAKSMLSFGVMFAVLLLFFYRVPGGGTGNLSNETMVSKYLTDLMLDYTLARHILSAVFLFSCLAVMIRFLSLEKKYTYFLLLALTLFVPAAVFSETYGASSGAAQVLLPTTGVLLYFYWTVEIFRTKGKKKTWFIPLMFVTGAVTALFSLQISLAFLLLSGLILLFYTKKNGFSFHLGAHPFGVILGFGVSVISAESGLEFLRLNGGLIGRLDTAVDSILVQNWIVSISLTAAALMLIQPVRSERSKSCNSVLRSLFISFSSFIVIGVMSRALTPVSLAQWVLTVGKLFSAGLYLFTLGRVVKNYVSRDSIKLRFRFSCYGTVIFALSYCIGDAGRECLLFIPSFLMVGISVMLLSYAFHRYGRLEKLVPKPAMLLSLAMTFAMCWIHVSNGLAYDFIPSLIQDPTQGEYRIIELPRVPYPAYACEVTEEQYQERLSHIGYKDPVVHLVPFEDWDWDSWKSTRNLAEDDFDEKNYDNTDSSEIPDINELEIKDKEGF